MDRTAEEHLARRGRRRWRLTGLWTVVATISLATSGMAIASLPASASTLTATSSTLTATSSTCSTTYGTSEDPTGIFGGAAVKPTTSSAGYYGKESYETILMTAALYQDSCTAAGLFTPLSGQTVHFAEEDGAGNWWSVCTATTDSLGVAMCSGTTQGNYVITVNTPIPASQTPAAWSAVFVSADGYQGSSDYGQFKGVPQPGPGQLGVYPAQASPPIQIKPEYYTPGCHPLQQIDSTSLTTLLTDGGNCQLIKIESDITTAVLGAATAVIGGEGFFEVGFDELAAGLREAATQALSKEIELSNLGLTSDASTTVTSGVVKAATFGAVTSTSVEVGSGILASVGTAFANGTLTVGSGNSLQIGSGATLQNNGVIYNEGFITTADISGLGSGTLINAGTILGRPPAGIVIKGNNYTLKFDSAGGSEESPIQVLAPTVAASGQALPTPTPPSGSNELFTGWVTPSNTPVTDGTELSPVLANGPSTTTLTATYGPQDVTIHVDVPNNSSAGCSGGQADGGQIACGNLTEALRYVDTDNFFAGHGVTIDTGAGRFGGDYTVSLPSDVSGLTIQGQGNSATIEDGSGAAGSVFCVTSGNVTISDMTITGGTTGATQAQLGNADYAGDGGGVYVDHAAEVTLSDDTITGNSASRSGGGVYNQGGTVTITDSLLTADSALTGGGVENSAFFSSPPAMGKLTMTNDTLTGDSAGSGGALYSQDSTSKLTFDTVAFDTATSAGSGIYADEYYGGRPYGSVTLANSILDSAGCQALAGGGTFTDGGYNVESDNTCGLGSTGSTSIVNSHDIGLATSLSFETGQPAQTPEVLTLPGSSPAALEVPDSNCTVGSDAVGVARPQKGTPHATPVRWMRRSIPPAPRQFGASLPAMARRRSPSARRHSVATWAGRSFTLLRRLTRPTPTWVARFATKIV